MIDIHAHIIPSVDDGCSSIEAAIKLIREEISLGVTDIICTPHFRKGMFEATVEENSKGFLLLLEEVKKQRLDVRLYLGQEIYMSKVGVFKGYLDSDFIMGLNQSKYFLLEFPYARFIDISEVIYDANLLGFKTIVAHVERYCYVTIDDVAEMKSSKALIQVNASSIAGKYGFRIKRKVMKLMKNNLVDFVASDIHEMRVNYFGKAYKIVKKKFGLEYATKVFEMNARKLIKKVDE